MIIIKLVTTNNKIENHRDRYFLNILGFIPILKKNQKSYLSYL